MPLSNQPATSSAPLTGRTTGLVFFGVVALCIILIGLAGWVKYELDKAGAALASPQSHYTAEQTALDKIRLDLGYGGLLGTAQSFATSHDAAAIPDMKEQLKQATESLEHLPQKTNDETRRALQAIVGTFTAAVQKAEKSSLANSNDFSSLDLAPLYATLPVLDERVASIIAADRTAQQEQVQLWAMVQTIISWVSLIIASSLAAGIYLALRGRNSAPLRALAQSVKNMARGDMRTSIWGMERQDAIGELARSVDMARFHFSQLPDMSLLSEQGPVRIRFEGNTRSLFEAMMRVISRDSEQVHEQANQLTENVAKHQETLNEVIKRVESVLQIVENRAVAGDQQVRQALTGIIGSAESLKNAQEHATDQLNRIIPFLQERTQGISEITQIAGRQVTQALQSLSSSERGLRSSAEQSEAAIQKFSSVADTLGERMFGAVNLLQASGKVLSETTSTIQSKLGEALAHLTSSKDVNPSNTQSAAFNSAIAERFGAIVEALESSQSKLQQLLAEQAQSAKAHIDLLITQSGSLLTQTSTSSQTLSSASDRLREEQEKMGLLLSRLDEISQRPASQSQPVEAIISPLLVDIREGFATIEQRFAEIHDRASVSSQTFMSATDRLHFEQSQLAELLNKVRELVENPPNREPVITPDAIAAPILNDLRAGFGTIEERYNTIREDVATIFAKLTDPKTMPIEMSNQMREHWFQMAGQIEASRSNLAQIIMQQTDKVEEHLSKVTTSSAAPSENKFVAEAQEQLGQQTHILSELVNALGLIDAHMQDLIGHISGKYQKAS